MNEWELRMREMTDAYRSGSEYAQRRIEEEIEKLMDSMELQMMGIKP